MVDDYLSDREQEEALRNWWRDNWRWIIGGIVLGAAVLAGWRYWQAHTTKQAEEAASLYSEYQTAGADVEKAKAPFDRLSSEFPSSPYTLQARLLQAKQYVDTGRYEEAATQLRTVADTAKDEELAQIARQRLARVLIQQGKHDEALALLDPEKAGKFAPQVREIRGDALVAKGDNDAARAEYAAALAADADAQVDRSLLEMKLQQVGGTAPEPATETATQGQP
jgi:predicted negative regulator of RcsB-dependent stress response